MEAASPARLFATLVGAALVIYGIVGFFYDSSFARPGNVDEALGLLSVNGWQTSSTSSPARSASSSPASPRAATRCGWTACIAIAVWGFVSAAATRSSASSPSTAATTSSTWPWAPWASRRPWAPRLGRRKPPKPDPTTPVDAGCQGRMRAATARRPLFVC